MKSSGNQIQCKWSLESLFPIITFAFNCVWLGTSLNLLRIMTRAEKRSQIQFKNPLTNGFTTKSLTNIHNSWKKFVLNNVNISSTLLRVKMLKLFIIIFSFFAFRVFRYCCCCFFFGDEKQARRKEKNKGKGGGKKHTKVFFGFLSFT